MNASYLARCEAAAAEQHNKRLERELELLEKKHDTIMKIVKKFRVYQMNLKKGTINEHIFFEATKDLFSDVNV